MKKMEGIAFDLGQTLLEECRGAERPAKPRPSRLMPGVEPVLGVLGLPLAVWTNTTTAREAEVRAWLRQARIEHFFAHVITSQEAGARKPAPAFFDVALKRCGWKRESVLFVGNQLNTDIGGGAGCGIATVWLSDPCHRSVDDDPAAAVQPTYTIANLWELPALLRRLRAAQ